MWATVAGTASVAACVALVPLTAAQAAGNTGVQGDVQGEQPGEQQGEQETTHGAGLSGTDLSGLNVKRLIATVTAGGTPTPSFPITAPQYTAGQWAQLRGNLTEDDRQLLIKVRQAGLWEMPSGQLAQTKSASPAVRAVGAQLAVDHQALDAATRQMAAELQVSLPGVPNPQQQQMLRDEQEAAPGQAFDMAFANYLRKAHGKVFTFIAQVRISTTNPAIRAFADVGNAYVARHMALLESTGLVTHQALDPNSASALGPVSAQSNGWVSDRLVYAAFALLLLVGGFGSAIARSKRKASVKERAYARRAATLRRVPPQRPAAGRW